MWDIKQAAAKPEEEKARVRRRRIAVSDMGSRRLGPLRGLGVRLPRDTREIRYAHWHAHMG